jgi:N-acetylglucosaminyl-diphospho-decaprenol L-rhamnosyltransferase
VSRDFDVVLVNNSQADQMQIAAMAAEFGADLIQNSENLGYGRGCNLGARTGRAQPYTLFLNPDVRVTSDVLQRMIAAADSDPTIVALGPLQCSKNGKVRGKRRAVGQGTAFGAPLRQVDATGALVETGFISGGALMVRSDVLDRIGGFDERIFLFHEDDDLCLRLARHGRLVYATGITVTHHYGTSTPRTEDLTRLRAWHLGFSRIYVLRKHFGRDAARAAVSHAVLKFLSPQMLTTRGRIKARAFMAGTQTALRQGDVLASAKSV